MSLGDPVSAALNPSPPSPAGDCLFVNVTAPADAQERPVLVWLHGGGYQVGSGSDIAGAGIGFARSHGAEVVTFNYRLGALGFLSLDGEQHTGAYGLHDQIALLRWVRDNIASFGGDPRQVTIYGVSAGAKSVGNLISSPLAGGLFQRAASSSGGAEYVATPQQSAAVACRFLKELGTSVARLRDVPAEEVLHAQQRIADGIRAVWVWRPAIDGLALSRRPVDAIAAGSAVGAVGAIAAGSAVGVALLAEHCVDECGLYQLMEPERSASAVLPTPAVPPIAEITTVPGASALASSRIQVRACSSAASGEIGHRGRQLPWRRRRALRAAGRHQQFLKAVSGDP
jgi:para-nitrobenzyl esterase